MFFWNSLAFSMIQQMLAIWSLVPLPFLNQLEHLEVHGSCIPHLQQHLVLWIWAILTGAEWYLIVVLICNSQNSAVATGLEKVSFHFNPKEG